MSLGTGFEVSTHRLGEVEVVSAAGEIDLASKDSFRTALWEAAPSGANEIVVDLSDVAFMDSSGLAVLCEAMDRLSANGCRLRVLTAPGPVRKVIELCGLAGVLAPGVPTTA